MIYIYIYTCIYTGVLTETLTHLFILNFTTGKQVVFFKHSIYNSIFYRFSVMSNAPNQQPPVPSDVQHPENGYEQHFQTFKEKSNTLSVEEFVRLGNKSKSTNGPKRYKEQISVQPQQTIHDPRVVN